MPNPNGSLLDGRNVAPLSDQQKRSVAATFYELDAECPVRFGDNRTVFRIANDGDEQVAEVIFGADIFPGANIIDANSTLGMKAAAAHEICHWRRHVDMREIDEVELMHIDEALTSLEAARRFPKHLSVQDVEQLIGDAMQRLKLFVDEHRAKGG